MVPELPRRKLHRSCVNCGHLASKVIHRPLVKAATKSHLLQGAGSLPAPDDGGVGRFWKTGGTRNTLAAFLGKYHLLDYQCRYYIDKIFDFACFIFIFNLF